MEIPNPFVNVRWPRLLRKAFVFVLLLLVLAILGGYATNLYAYHKARNLLLEVQRMDPGKTTVAEVKRLMERYGGEEFDAHVYDGSSSKDGSNPCVGESMSYAIFARPPFILTKAIEAFPSLQKLGLYQWGVSVNIDYKDGKVTCYSQWVGFVRPDGQEVEASANLEQRNPQWLVEKKPYEADSFISRSHYHHTSVNVLTEASAEEKTRAFQMDLSCIISLRGCYFPCQIIPLGWLDSVRDRQLHSWDLPEGSNDPRCPAH